MLKVKYYLTWIFITLFPLLTVNTLARREYITFNPPLMPTIAYVLVGLLLIERLVDKYDPIDDREILKLAIFLSISSAILSVIPILILYPDYINIGTIIGIIYALLNAVMIFLFMVHVNYIGIKKEIPLWLKSGLVGIGLLSSIELGLYRFSIFGFIQKMFFSPESSKYFYFAGAAIALLMVFGLATSGILIYNKVKK